MDQQAIRVTFDTYSCGRQVNTVCYAYVSFAGIGHCIAELDLRREKEEVPSSADERLLAFLLDPLADNEGDNVKDSDRVR